MTCYGLRGNETGVVSTMELELVDGNWKKRFGTLVSMDVFQEEVRGGNVRNIEGNEGRRGLKSRE